MKTLIFKTDNRNFAATIARFFLAVTLFPHGAQKAFGWFGGYGFEGTMTYFTETEGMPYALGLLVIAIEVLGPLALLLGLGTRILGMTIAGLMTGIALKVHLPNGFFMNWDGNQAGEGFEFFLPMIGLALSLLYTGGGFASLDQRLAAQAAQPAEAAGKARQRQPEHYDA